MPSPTLPPLALPEASQCFLASGKPRVAPLVLQPGSHTANLPRMYAPPYVVPAPHPSPQNAGVFGLPVHGGHPATPRTPRTPKGSYGEGGGAYGEGMGGHRSPTGLGLGPENDGFEAELRFYLYGEEVGSSVFG